MFELGPRVGPFVDRVFGNVCRRRGGVNMDTQGATDHVFLKNLKRQEALITEDLANFWLPAQ
jgi:hypothetical protein